VRLLRAPGSHSPRLRPKASPSSRRVLCLAALPIALILLAAGLLQESRSRRRLSPSQRNGLLIFSDFEYQNRYKWQIGLVFRPGSRSRISALSPAATWIMCVRDWPRSPPIPIFPDLIVYAPTEWACW